MYPIQKTTTLAELHRLLTQSKLTLSTAESCTGGLMAAWLTELPGSSVYYFGGAASYSNFAKQKFLGVQEASLTEFGAVSEQVAKEMALGVSHALRTDFGVSITGIAGPDGGSAAKPVGTVWCGLSYHENVKATLLKCHGDRAEIRTQAMDQALDLLLSWVKEWAKSE